MKIEQTMQINPRVQDGKSRNTGRGRVPPPKADPPASASGTKSRDDSAMREERIARAAYLLSERDGFPTGRDLDYWLQAEADLERESARPKR